MTTNKLTTALDALEEALNKAPSQDPYEGRRNLMLAAGRVLALRNEIQEAQDLTTPPYVIIEARKAWKEVEEVICAI